MKKKLIVSRFLPMAMILLIACNEQPKKHEDIGKIEVDSALMALIKPSNEVVVANLATVTPEERSGAMLVEVQGVANYDSRNERSIVSRVGGRIEKLYIKYNYQPVKSGELIAEIYAPDLAAAQQELLYLAQRGEDANLLQKAKQRLALLGMNTHAIEKVLQTKRVNYSVPIYSNVNGFVVDATSVSSNVVTSALPQNTTNTGMVGMDGGTTPVAANTLMPNNPQSSLAREGQYVNAGEPLFKIYQSNNLVAEFAIKPALVAHAKQGSKLILYRSDDKEKTFGTTIIELVQPLIKSGDAFALVKVNLPQGFKVGELMTAKIPMVVPKSYWLPVTAVSNSGHRTVIFKKENGVFVARKIKAGLVMNGKIQILDNINNWAVAQNAAYLVDSESFIQAK